MEEEKYNNDDIIGEEEKQKHKKKKKKHNKKRRVDVKMEVINEQPRKISPVIGYFPSGFNPHNDDEESQSPQVRIFKNEEKPNRLQIVVSPKDSKVDFVGGTHTGSESAVTQVCTYALGVLDKDTQTLKIVPIASNKILRLEPVIGGSGSLDNGFPKERKEENCTEEQKDDKMTDLTNLYGSKRSIIKAKKRKTLVQKTDPSNQKDFETKIEGVKINKEALQSAVADPARNIPPHDSNATTPEKAYPLGHIIPTAEWDSLLDILERFQGAHNIDPDAYPSFVCSRIHKLHDIEDEVEQKKLACIFSYITHLIKFKDERSADFASSAKNHKTPGILRNKFRTVFTDSEKFSLSVEKMNLLISYVLVLTLHADGFRTDLSDIAKDLRMSSMSLREHYKNLGCKLTREDKLMFVVLPLPLQFPKPKMRRRR